MKNLPYSSHHFTLKSGSQWAPPMDMVSLTVGCLNIYNRTLGFERGKPVTSQGVWKNVPINICMWHWLKNTEAREMTKKPTVVAKWNTRKKWVRRNRNRHAEHLLCIKRFCRTTCKHLQKQERWDAHNSEKAAILPMVTQILSSRTRNEQMTS